MYPHRRHECLAAEPSVRLLVDVTAELPFYSTIGERDGVVPVRHEAYLVPLALGVSYLW